MEIRHGILSTRPRILLLGDYSNCHRTLYTALTRLGYDVTQMSAGSSWMNVDRQIDISRSPGKLGGLKLYARARFGDISRLTRGYDIVAIHDLNFLNLKPVRLRPLFDILRRQNGKIFLTAMSTDIAYLDMVSATDCPLRYSEWFIGDKPSPMQLADPGAWARWHDKSLVDYQRYALDHIDGAVSVLYEYHLGMQRALGADRVWYGGIPIDPEALGVFYGPVSRPDNGKIELFLGRDRNRIIIKGTDLLEQAARLVVAERPDIASLRIVENVPYRRFINLLLNTDIVLDQVYSYTPATTALMAMTMGHCVVSGGEPEYYEFVGAGTNRPIINATTDVEAMARDMMDLIDDRRRLAALSAASRDFALRHNNAPVVARRFLDAWLR